jgi:hypothetical protein
MDLRGRIQKIINETTKNPEEFGQNVGMSVGSVYNIINGKTKSIRKNTAEKINEVYSAYDVDWIMGINPANVFSEDNVLNSGSLGLFLDRNHQELLNTDDTYRLWFEKVSLSKAMSIVKDLIAKNQGLQD